MYLRAGVEIGGRVESTSQGVPQGGPLSPLLANILLDDLDKELERRGHSFARYADDFIILVKSPRAGERVKQSISGFLEKKLKLKINREKSKTGKANQAKFLGFCFPGKTIRWTTDALEDFKHRIRELTARSWGISMEDRITKLNEYLRGWMGYFGLAAQLKLFDHFDQWLRRRLRMCFWKRWRLTRTRRRELIRLGVPRRQAIRHARSRKGPWHMAKSIATGVGLTNAWLAAQGLLSLKSLWAELAPLRRTA